MKEGFIACAVTEKAEIFINTYSNPLVRAFTLPEWQPFVNRLKAAGKTGKQIVCAIMRKLLVYCFTVLKSGRPYDPQIQAA